MYLPISNIKNHSPKYYNWVDWNGSVFVQTSMKCYTSWNFKSKTTWEFQNKVISEVEIVLMFCFKVEQWICE